ncbi:hypothetical protein M413DRAFT_169203 [Hebeloma cylindrosporum]|uniref:Uncharacterized protein n=1 Tax=Hebeloma cylindrosporum TaxID=76867 RepID=A0A0C2XR33_HEBCY|nr:hypothetical protein M413DRAFT_169203 [Hebeloma cylindrosporum h7]
MDWLLTDNTADYGLVNYLFRGLGRFWDVFHTHAHLTTLSYHQFFTDYISSARSDSAPSHTYSTPHSFLFSNFFVILAFHTDDERTPGPFWTLDHSRFSRLQ